MASIDSKFGPCHNCGTLEPFTVQVPFSAPLFPTDSVTVGDVMMAIFKPTMASSDHSSSLLCTECTGILQDLYPPWKSFLEKSIRSDVDVSPLVILGGCDSTVDSLDLQEHVQPPKRVRRARLKEKIARKRSSESLGDSANVNVNGAADPDQPSNLRPRRSCRTKVQVPVMRDDDEVDDDEEDRDPLIDNDTDFNPEEDTSTIQTPIPPKEPLSQKRSTGIKKELEGGDDSDDEDGDLGSFPFVCTECGKRLQTEYGLKQHVNKAHLRLRGPFKCPMDNCGKLYKLQSALQEHVNTHTGNRPFVCDLCGLTTTGRQLLRMHQIRMHSTPEEKEVLKNKVCDLCGAKFLTVGGLSMHLASHSTDKPFPCSVDGCELKFKSRQRMHRHVKEVHFEVTAAFSCDRCGRPFLRKYNLAQHLLVHDKYDDPVRAEQSRYKKMRKSRDPPPRVRK